MHELTLLNLINRVDELPEVPQISFKAIQLLNHPETAVSDLAEVISSDQALTAKILRLCNSSFYGLSRQITTVSEAVMIVGFSAVKSLVLMITTQSSLNKGLLGYKLAPGDFWLHSISTAESARHLAQHLKLAKPEEYFIAGLIHDLGKMILNQYALPEVYRATHLHLRENLPLHEAEKQILGFTHAEVGAALAERWNFPDVLVESIRHHHRLQAFEEMSLEAPFAPVIAIANLVAHALDPNHNLSWENAQFQSRHLCEQLGLKWENLSAQQEQIRQHIEKTRELVLELD